MHKSHKRSLSKIKDDHKRNLSYSSFMFLNVRSLKNS